MSTLPESEGRQSEQHCKMAMTSEEFSEMLKTPEVRNAVRDLIVDLAVNNEFFKFPGLNLPGRGQR